MQHARAAREILQIVSRWEPFLLDLPATFGDSKAGSKWTVKEILGHLVDSAVNHHQYWVRLHDGDLRFPPYDQDVWVDRAGYSDFPWQDLIRLWSGHNRLMASIAMQIPLEALHNRWHDKDRDLKNLLDHYVEHLRHHLASIEGALE